jgi:hypothetical protein
MSDPIEASSLEQMRSRARPDTRWAAYENKAFDSASFGHQQFLLVGSGCTFQDPPEKLPSDRIVSWRYLFIGYANLETGMIELSELPKAL